MLPALFFLKVALAQVYLKRKRQERQKKRKKKRKKEEREEGRKGNQKDLLMDLMRETQE